MYSNNLLQLFALGGASLVAASPVAVRNNDNGGDGSAEPCSLLNVTDDAPFLSPSQVKACFQSVPFQDNVRQNIMSSVAAMYSLDIFQYNQLHDDDPSLNQGVDIDAEFARINSASYGSDYDFSSDLSNVIFSLNDGHHVWQSCYTQDFKIRHAFNIIAAKDDNSDETSIYIAPELAVYVKGLGFTDDYEKRGINVTDLAGAKVNSVDGVAVWDYLEDFAQSKVGVYQDPAQRLNYVFSGYTSDPTSGSFSRTNGAFTSRHDLNVDSFSLGVTTRNGVDTDVTVPWLTRYVGKPNLNFTSGNDLFNALCVLHDETDDAGVAGNATQTPASPDPANFSTVEEFAEAVYAACPTNFSQAAYLFDDEHNPQLSSAYLGGRDIQFYKLGQSNTGVAFVGTFSPTLKNASDNNDPCLNRFVLDSYFGLKNLTNAGVTQVLFDTSSNGGGFTVLSQILQRLVTGESFENQTNFEFVYRKSPLADALVEAHIHNMSAETAGGLWSPEISHNATSEADLSNTTNFFVPGTQRQVNGHTLYKSNLLYESLDDLESYSKLLNISDSPPFPAMDLAFTGNGLCGSACAEFANFLIEYYNGRGYIFTPKPERPIEFQAFAASTSSTSALIIAEADSLNIGEDILPRLKYQGLLGISVRAAITPVTVPGEFLQYRSFPAQDRYSRTLEQYVDPIANWEYVASQAFKS